MTVDEIIADLGAALELEDGAVPTHIIVIAEYLEPGSDDQPATERLSIICDDTLSTHAALGFYDYIVTELRSTIRAATD